MLIDPDFWKSTDTTMANVNLAELADRIRASGVPTHFAADQSRLLIAVWRQVVEGLPVSLQQVERHAKRLNMGAAAATAFIKQLSEQDDQGNIVGIFGLSQREHPHKFILGRKTFSTWCAWDGLFLPPMLGLPAQIESVCPQSQAQVRVKLTPRGVESCEPTGTVLSIVEADSASKGFSCVEEVWAAFCCDGRFFSSESTARQWFSNRERQATILTVDEGFELGRLAFRELLGYA